MQWNCFSYYFGKWLPIASCRNSLNPQLCTGPPGQIPVKTHDDGQSKLYPSGPALWVSAGKKLPYLTWEYGLVEK